MKLKTEKLAARVDRAKQAATRKCFYKLGRGGFNAAHPLNPCWDKDRSDCSGFVSHVLMTRRNPKPGRDFWIETTAIYRDATGKQTTFVEIDEPVPGCMVVYGDKNGSEGHIGIVVGVQCVNPGEFRYTTVECASGYLGKVAGKAIRYRENAQTLFGKKGAIFCVLKDDILPV